MTGTAQELPAPETAAVIDRFWQSLADGDLAVTRACATPDLVVWHSYDRLEQGLEESLAGWQKMFVALPERAFVDVRRSPVPGGWVQRHQLLARTAGGTRVGWPVAVFVTLQDGLVHRIDEYIDRAGTYEPADGVTGTPGLPAGREHTVL